MDGVLVVNKPAGMTSHDVVRRVRGIAKQRDVGHLGTLDPMATGVLPLVLGKMTRIAQFYDNAVKEYEGTIQFGLATDTYDTEGKPMSEPTKAAFSEADLEGALAGFRGPIDQTPPPYSAKKVDGVPAYKLARKNESVPLKSVRVTVHKLEVLEMRKDGISQLERLTGRELQNLSTRSLRFRAEVSAGTYIRSLAHDLGQVLGCGAYLQALCRTRSGDFRLTQSYGLEDLDQRADVTLQDAAIPSRQLLPGMPSVNATEEQMAKIRHGNAVNLAEFSQSEFVKVFSGPVEIVAIARRVAGTLFQPKIVLC